jgi:N-methylhydantoinase B
MAYRAEIMNLVNFGGGMSGSAYSAAGALGGLPAPPAHALVRRGTNIYEVFASGRVPAEIGELKAEQDLMRPQKANELLLDPTDVAEYIINGGGGYGDPLEREPWRVTSDLAQGIVSPEAASLVYGVKVGRDGELDDAATAGERERLHGQRADWPPTSDRFPPLPQPPVPARGEPARRVHEALVARDDGDRRVIACERCGTVICGYADDFKRHVLMHEGPTSAIPGNSTDPAERLDVEVVLRRYCCPGCTVMLGTEVARKQDEPWPDMLFRQ